LGQDIPHAKSTGLLTRKTPTLDVDIKNPDAATAVEALVVNASRIMVLFWCALASPQTAIPFRTDAPFRRSPLTLIAPDGDETQKIELLADGQQVVRVRPSTRTLTSHTNGSVAEPGVIRRGELPAINQTEAHNSLLTTPSSYWFSSTAINAQRIVQRKNRAPTERRSLG